jgi:hypothetical protein
MQKDPYQLKTTKQMLCSLYIPAFLELFSPFFDYLDM